MAFKSLVTSHQSLEATFKLIEIYGIDFLKPFSKESS